MIVLRFSDFGHDTIAEHASLIEQYRNTWWGWWKKQHEAWPAAQIGELGTLPIAVGLIERSSRLFFEATCVAVAHDHGKLIDSPEVSKTPVYYQNDAFPLWFKFESILPLHEDKWRRKYGEIPLRDDTFYFRGRADTGATEVPLVNATGESEVEFVEADAPAGRTGILHISDLHFGEDFGFLPTFDGVSGLDQLVELLATALPEPPAAVVVSGDLTTRYSVEGTRSAQVFLEALAKRLDLPRDCMVIAPGNHDIEVDDENHKKDFENEKGFRDFIELFYGRKTALDRVQLVNCDGGVSLAFGVVNSSRPRGLRTKDYGWVGRDRSEPIMQKLLELHVDRSAITFFVLHHHVQPAQEFEAPEHQRPISMTLDAGELVSLASAHRIKAILHGHQHLPFVGQALRLAELGRDGATKNPPVSHPVLIMAAGSAGARVTRLGDELRENSFSFYKPTSDEKLSIRVFCFNPKKSPVSLWDFDA